MLATYQYIGPDNFSSKRSVQIDDDMALWLGRMAVGESGKNVTGEEISCMCWAMLNRFFLHRQREKWRSFKYLVRRFSQPINPRWYRNGDLARKYANTEYTTEQKFRRRERISSLTWSQIGLEAGTTIEDFQLGLLEPPAEVLKLRKPRISDWASHKNLPKKFPWGIKIIDVGKRSNWFFENKRLIPGHVVVDYWG